MIKLYYSPRTRASRVRWMLEELGVPHELVRLDMEKREHKQPAYLAVHPHGLLPALVDEGHVLIESVAICLYLADKFPERGLAPAPGTPDRGHYYQWSLYVVGTIEPTLTTIATGGTPRIPIADIWGVLTRAIEGREFLIGGKFSTADILIGGGLQFGKLTKQLEGQPVLESYLARLMARPAFQRMRAD